MPGLFRRLLPLRLLRVSPKRRGLETALDLGRRFSFVTSMTINLAVKSSGRDRALLLPVPIKTNT
jgi:hypothetical protein